MELARRLRSRGYRSTPQREAVFDVLSDSAGRPIDAETVVRLAREKKPGLGVATVYRTLDLFMELGVIQGVHLHEGAQHYELSTGKHHHYVVCNSCGSTHMLEACTVDRLEEALKDESDFVVTSHCMTLFGYCPSCLPSG